MGKGYLSGFVPHRLEIEGRPELFNFPLNVLFVSFKLGKDDKEIIMGSALYEPLLCTFIEVGEGQSMIYLNKYGGNYWLKIFYNKEGGTYTGKKYKNEEEVLVSDGANWDGFFFHFTMLGLSGGERCLFD